MGKLSLFMSNTQGEGEPAGTEEEEDSEMKKYKNY